MSTQQPHLSRTQTGLAAQRGFMLIEVMVSVLIFSLGVLGLIGLQATLTQAQTAAKDRADASYLTSELAGLMWSDVKNLASYTATTSGADACSAYAPCDNWQRKVQNTLPQGNAAVTPNLATGNVTIVLTWIPTTSKPGDPPRSVTTFTNVSGN